MCMCVCVCVCVCVCGVCVCVVCVCAFGEKEHPVVHDNLNAVVNVICHFVQEINCTQLLLYFRLPYFSVQWRTGVRRRDKGMVVTTLHHLEIPKGVVGAILPCSHTPA